MARKIGILLVIVCCPILLFFSALIEKLDNEGLLIFSAVTALSMIPLGAALISINSNPARRNKVKRIYLIISVFLISVGLLSKFISFQGGGLVLAMGILWYCFAYAPLELKHKYLKWLPYSKNKYEIFSLSLFDFVGFNVMALGLLSRLQKWPGGWLLFFVGVGILLVGLFSWNYKFKTGVINRKKSEDKIKEQLDTIQDSIKYAKRIQSAILPPHKLVKQFLKNSFILYKPKDIVAGDFYWMENRDDKLFFAAADCTGHGVPGAIISVICNNGLNRSVREFRLTDPGQILDKTREIVLQEFEKSEDEIKDGMDIALCVIEKNMLKYAGANNPLWIIRKDAEEVQEIKANKQPIGLVDNPLPYLTHNFELEIGDTIYLFSDGFVDQFGGENDKKFKVSNFRTLLLSMQNETMEKQRQLIDDSFETWRGSLEQVDDVCIIGMRF